MRVDINLATQPYEDAGQFWMRWGSGLALLGVFTLVLISVTTRDWVSAGQDRKLMQQYRERIAERDKEKDDAQALMNLPQNSSTRDRSQSLNDLVYRKAFSWTQVFENLEQVMPPGLHVVSIHPETTLDNEQTSGLKRSTQPGGVGPNCDTLAFARTVHATELDFIARTGSARAGLPQDRG